jgi:hypothetical protein
MIKLKTIIIAINSGKLQGEAKAYMGYSRVLSGERQYTW